MARKRCLLSLFSWHVFSLFTTFTFKLKLFQNSVLYVKSEKKNVKKKEKDVLNYTNEVTEPVTTCFGESFRFHLIPIALVVFPRKGPLSKGFRV